MITPYVYEDVGDIGMPFPFSDAVTDDVVNGWEPTGIDWFVDSSGVGRPGESALTPDQFTAELRDYVAENPGHGFAITGIGQFQVYVGAFRLKGGE